IRAGTASSSRNSPSRKETFGYSFRNSPTRCASGSTASPAVAWMSNRPRGSPAASTSAPSAATTSRRICRAGPTKALPAAVSTMPRPMRWKSSTPSSRSRARIAWETVGCASCRAFAAALIPLWSTTARKYSTWCNSTAWRLVGATTRQQPCGSQPERLGDDRLHHLGRASEDAGHPSVGVHPGDRVLQHVPVAAVQLQAAVDHPGLQLGAVHLHLGRVRRGELPDVVLLQRPVQQRPPRLDLHRATGQLELRVLERGHRFAENPALLHVFERGGQRGFR